jgi:hypothetical protein
MSEPSLSIVTTSPATHPSSIQPQFVSKAHSTSGFIVDFSIYAFLLLLGAYQLAHYPHAVDFLSDVTYPDLARSILEKGSYEIRLLPQTTLPPGLPFILAFVGKFAELTPAVAFGVIAVFTAAGLIAAYELLRRVEGRGVAAVACMLLASSPAAFGLNTAVVFPEMPYFFMSMAALLLTRKIDRARQGNGLTVWILLLGMVLILAILIRSVGIALLLGLIAWTAASFPFAEPGAGPRRMKRFLIPLALGLAVQLTWGLWAQHHQTLEWQLPGYPGSYISQLKVKNGQYPELGLARASDISARVEQNIVTRAAGFSQLLVRRNVSKFWSSPAIIGVLAVVGMGLAVSLRNAGQLHDWYFLAYEFIFLVWPWDYRDRFVIPVLPLGFLYLWRGGKAIKSYLIIQPRKAGLAFAVFGSILCVCSALFVFRLATFPANPDNARGDRLQPIAAMLFWGVLALGGLAIFLLHQRDGGAFYARITRVFEPASAISFRLVTTLAVAFLVVSGIKGILAIGRIRSNPQITQEFLYPEIEASEWIRNHVSANSVVMAREPEFVYHYAQQPTVWFPPISDPKVLMDGIRRLHVDLVVVADHPSSYWLPSESACFEMLERAYPSDFRLVHTGPRNRVFDVVSSAQGD